MALLSNSPTVPYTAAAARAGLNADMPDALWFQLDERVWFPLLRMKHQFGLSAKCVGLRGSHEDALQGRVVP